MKTLVSGFALAGFLIGVCLGVYAFYLTSHQQTGNAWLFVGLCPPSIGAMALDNGSMVTGIVAWLFISVMNGALYGLFGLLVGLTRTKQNKSIENKRP